MLTKQHNLSSSNVTRNKTFYVIKLPRISGRDLNIGARFWELLHNQWLIIFSMGRSGAGTIPSEEEEVPPQFLKKKNRDDVKDSEDWKVSKSAYRNVQ